MKMAHSRVNSAMVILAIPHEMNMHTPTGGVS